jgi:uncharacterized membrane protein
MTGVIVAAGGQLWGAVVEPWEVHPMILHFPIAFLLGGVALDLYGWARGSAGAVRAANGLLVAGVLTGLITAAAGWLAMETVPAHTARAHDLMRWHMYTQLASVGVFAVAAFVRWRRWDGRPGWFTRLLGWVAAVAITVGSGLGGYIVYHGGAGVELRLLADWLKAEHQHGHGD